MKSMTKLYAAVPTAENQFVRILWGYLIGGINFLMILIVLKWLTQFQ